MRILAGLLCACALNAASPFAFREISAASLQLEENGKPVYVYNHGPMRDANAPARYERCCYVHPLYAPDGTVVTDDFPRDHYHHRGLSWMWPVVIVDGQQYDLWVLKGIRHRFVRWLGREVEAGRAVLRAENGWFLDDGRQVAREQVEIAATPGHKLELQLTIEAMDSPVTISGTPDLNKGYGALGLRFAPRKDTVLRTDKGVEAKDSDMVPHAWAELEGTFANGRRAGARVDVDTSSAGFPNGWCLRHYGYLGANFPGLQKHTIEPGKPLVLRYRITAFSR
jgi:hypothetical protein